MTEQQTDRNHGSDRNNCSGEQQLITERRIWARVFIDRARGKPLPVYGSRAWFEADDVVRVASCVLAAEAWASDGDRLEERVEDYSWAAWRAAKQQEDEDWQADVEEHRSRWSYLSKCTWPGAYAGQGEPRPLGELFSDYRERRRVEREGGGAA